MSGFKIWQGAALAAGMVMAGAPAGADDLLGDPEAGKKVYRLCIACHSVEDGKNRAGPHLHNLIGRKAGSIEGFRYSKPHKESGIVWTKETLDPYLENPAEYIPGNRMMFAGVKDDRMRADLIAYLASEEVSPDAPQEADGGESGGE
ncbi:MAG: c-type cytochrome [Alphaproteobacteria bacterium]